MKNQVFSENPFASKDARSGNRFNRFLSFGIGIILALFMVASSVKAQCPTDITPTDPDLPWTGPIMKRILIPGTDCYVIYHYCKRTIDGTQQYYLEDYGPDPTNPTDCNSLLWYTMLIVIREDLIQTTPNTDPCGHEGNIATIVAVYSGQCASFVRSPSLACKLCGGAYCEKVCDVCHDPYGVVIESNCQVNVIGSASCPTLSVWSTLTVSAVASISWGYSLDQCYFIGCDGM